MIPFKLEPTFFTIVITIIFNISYFFLLGILYGVNTSLYAWTESMLFEVNESLYAWTDSTSFEVNVSLYACIELIESFVFFSNALSSTLACHITTHSSQRSVAFLIAL